MVRSRIARLARARSAAARLGRGYQYRSLAVYNPDGSVRTPIVSDALIAHLGGSLVLWDRLRLSVNLPIQAYAMGETGTLAGMAYQPPVNAPALGDLRLGMDVRLFGQYGDAITGAIGFQAWLPTGDRDSYAGDGAFRIAPRALVAGDIGVFFYSAKLGFQYRTHSGTFGASPVGSELFYAASAGLRLADKRLVVRPELFGSTVTESDQLFGRRTTPLKGLLGGHHTAGSIRVGAGIRARRSRGYGTPILHVLANVEWAPRFEAAAPTDRDHVGIYDQDDACPEEPGLKTRNPRAHGCPVHDGILEKDDACIDVPGTKAADFKTNGCPTDPDRDKDGIPNDPNTCPHEPGKPDPDPKRNGGPKAFVKAGQIVILDQVQFKTARADILPGKDSLEALEAVSKVLNDRPETKHLRVDGHTDSRGDAGYNKKLSANRAASVVAWLDAHGVAAGRLASAGFGPERPNDTNVTDAGRQQRRRVEFHIDEEKN